MPNQVRTWEENYALLVAYKESNGDCMVPLRYQTDKILGKWVSTQRESRYVLKPDRKELLDAIGFEWNPRQRRSDDKWNKMYERLLVYRELHNNELSTVFTANNKSNNKGKGSSGNPDPELVKWCCNQREYSGRGLLNEERYNKLRDIGFPVRAIQKSVQAKREQEDQGAETTASTSPSATSSSKQQQQQQSNKKKRKKTNKNLQIPSLSPTLSSAFPPSALSPMMVQSNGSSNKPGDAASCSPTAAADMLGSPSTVVVAPPGTSVRRRSWLESFAALQDFKEQFGHCRVPIQYKQDKQLGIWVGEQKKKKFLMSQERREKLEQLGFTWANPRDKQWSTMYEKLVLYRQEHPQNNGTKPKNFNLRKWLEAQRHAILEGSLSQDCVEKLRAIGYDYSGGDNDKGGLPRRTSMDSSESLEAAETSSEAASSSGEDSSSSHHEEDPHFVTTTTTATSASVSLLLPTKRQVSLLDDEDEDDKEGQASNSNSGTIAAAPMGAVESLLSLSAPNQKKPNDESASDVMVVGPPKKRPRTASVIIEQHLLPPPPQELAVPVPKAATQHFHHGHYRNGNLNMAVEAAAAGTSAATPLLSHQRLAATNNAASTISNTSKNRAAHVPPIDQMLALQQQQQQQQHRHLLGSNNDRHVMMQLQQHQQTAAATNAAPPTHAELEQLKLADLYLSMVKQLDCYRR